MTDYMNPAEFANIARSERDLWWYRGMRTILFRLLDRYAANRRLRRVLEAGCGTGYLSLELQKERGWPVVPMDIAADGLRYAQKMGIHRPVQGDITRLPFPDGAFDAVLSMDVLAQLPRPLEFDAMGDLARVLAPRGLLVIRTSALDFLRSRHSAFVFERQRFTRKRLVNLADGAGIRVLRCTYANSLLLPVAVAKFRILEPLLRRPPMTGVEPVAPWLDRALYAPLAAEASWIGAGRDLPAGQSLFLVGEKT